MQDVMNNSAANVIGNFKTDVSTEPEENESEGKPILAQIADWWQNSALNPGTWQKKIQDMLGITNVKESVNSAASQGKIAYTSTGIPYDETNIDSRINAEMQEYANKRDDEAYDRLIAALKRNGINPALALSNSASPMSTDSGFRSSYSLTDKDQINSALKAGSILALLATLLMKKR